jgi:hypothetical protein
MCMGFHYTAKRTCILHLYWLFKPELEGMLPTEHLVKHKTLDLSTSETSVNLYNATWRNNPQDSRLHTDHSSLLIGHTIRLNITSAIKTVFSLDVRID